MDDLTYRVARNLRTAMAYSQYQSYRAIGQAAGVAANSVRNVMDPKARTVGARGDTAPRLDVAEKIAHALGFELWQILHPDFGVQPPKAIKTVRTKTLANPGQMALID